MSVVDDVLQRVRVQVAQRRLRLEDFFAGFDTLHSGRITAGQFRRALAVNNIHLSDEEHEALKNTFAASATSRSASRRPPSEGTLADVSYVLFLQALRAEDPPAELLTTLGRRAKVLSDEEERILTAASNSLRHSVRARGIHLRKAFEDFDPFRSGKVTASQFRRCMPFEMMREDVLRLIIKKYSNEDGDVLYAAWCKDLEGDSASSRAAAPAALSSPVSSPRAISGPLSADELLSVLRSQFAMYRLRCDDFLRSCDPFRTGFVTAPQFESALGQLRFVNFHLTAEHILTLTRAYADASLGGTGSGTNEEVFPRVNYVQFLADTNPYSDGIVPGSTKYYEMSRVAGQFFDDDDPEQERAKAVVKKVRQLISSNRIYLTPTLHDFDRVKKGIYEHRTCTESRFLRSLATNKIFLKPEEISLLVKRYRICSADGSPSDEVNYYQFVMDVDQSHRPELNPARLLKCAALTDLQKESEGARPPPANTLPAVLAKVVQQAEERHLRVNEFFIDFDPLRSGIVQTEKFAVALGIAGLMLHPEELDLLQTEYKSTKARDHIDVNRFVADVGEIAPTVVPSVTTRFNFTASRSGTGSAAAAVKNTVPSALDKLTDAERELLPRLLARLAHDVVAHHALLTPFFSDFDRMHRGKISSTSFVRALVRHRFVLSPEETKLLLRYYASPNDTELIEYTRFVRDVGFDEAALGSQLKQATTSVHDADQSEMAKTTEVVGWERGYPPHTAPDGTLVERVLTKICCFLQERNARLSEFFPDGDELRHRHVTNTRFRHCVSILGLDLTEEELQALEAAFAHGELRGHVDYPSFFFVVSEKLRAGVGLMAVMQRRRGSPVLVAAADSTDGAAAATQPQKSVGVKGDLQLDTQSSVKSLEDAQAKLYESAMGKVRRTLAARRTVSLTAFRQYDRARKGFVKEGQFFATLMSLGVQLSPTESDAIRKVHSIGGGEIGYTKFSDATDDKRFI